MNTHFVRALRAVSGGSYLKRALLVSTTSICAMAPSLASAQQGGTPTRSAEGAVGLEEIVVTARRREENIERVPITVTALGAEELAERSINTEQDLQAAVPGLTVLQTQTSNNLSFSIRGQGIDAQSGSRPGVLPYVDEVQVNTQTASSFFDLASVQILKGPQGTLFGRNATGGAVLYTTAKPTHDFGGYITVGAGNYNLREVQGAINIPIVQDKVALRLSGNLDKRDGFVTNVFSGSKLGEVESKAIRASLLLTPTDSLQNTTVFQYGEDEGTNLGPELQSAYACGATNGGIPLATTFSCVYSPALDFLLGAPGAWNAYLAAHPKAPPGGLAAYVAQQEAMGPYKVSFDNPSIHESENWYGVNTTTYDISPDLQIKNIIGATSSTANDNTDLDGTPYTIVETVDTAGNAAIGSQDIDQFSEEFQILGKAFGQRLDYILGVYYGHETDTRVLPSRVADLSPIIPAEASVAAAKLTNSTKAVYAQGTYNLSDMTGISGLSLTGGLRYTWESNKLKLLPPSEFFGAAAESQSVSEPSWTIGLEERLTPDLMLYVVTRGSFRSGGFNIFSPPTADQFEPEKTRDVELGMKFSGTTLGVGTRLNVAVFNQWVDDVQRAVYVIIPATGTIGAVTANVPEAEIRGFELDASIAPSSWLEIGGNVAYTDATYTDKNVSLFGSAFAFGPYAGAPEWSGSIYGQVDLPVPDAWGNPVFRADLYRQSSIFYSNLADTVAPDTSIKGYTTVNLRLDWHDFALEGVTLSAFGKNVTDERYYVGGFALGAGIGINGVIPGMPKTYGVELSYKF